MEHISDYLIEAVARKAGKYVYIFDESKESVLGWLEGNMFIRFEWNGGTNIGYNKHIGNKYLVGPNTNGNPKTNWISIRWGTNEEITMWFDRIDMVSNIMMTKDGTLDEHDISFYEARNILVRTIE